MSAARHTPGPWTISKDDGQSCMVAARGKHIAKVLCSNSLADAHLIAAAPELLTALQLALPAFEAMRKQWPRHKGDDSLDVVEFSKAAIAKATKGAA